MVWASLDAWRHNPAFKPKFNVLFPGLLLSVGVITVYSAFSMLKEADREALYEPSDPVVGFK